ncbi:angiopoietin-related protein 3-like isoform X2 [Kryptolebias marmoratus]|uniref:angiopoietin-related protein 3-like isoform X2 n=1 Tax=Kryptolebias marmoratus TaxID=37003 RepID=UPI0018ACC4B3|nr:angiopoietin-related protein 3-like isoform X2 [Kryptolebias marmoratus]
MLVEESPTLHPEPPTETWPRFAPLDDVRLLANNLLQLGQSMREFAQKTKGQMNSIFQKLNIFDRSFYRLSALAGELKEDEEELKKTTVILRADNEVVKDLSGSISSKMESLLQEKSRLQNKVDGLEEKVSRLTLGLPLAEISSLRDVIKSQEQSISELLKAVAEQSEQLDQQKLKIKTLEKKLTASVRAQETSDKTPESSNSEAPTLPPFLTSGSSSITSIKLASDCSELFLRGERASDVYAVQPNGSERFMAFCDMSREPGATVIQRRTEGSLTFDQPWEKYENGFGNLQTGFWFGLRKIHSLASRGDAILQIQLEDWKQNKRFAQYRFHLDGPESNYTIHLTHLSGNLTDPMSNHTGVGFSTRDRYSSHQQETKCAQQKSGGWWFNPCGDFNPNGRYFNTRRSQRRRGIQWRSGQKVFSLRFTQISITFPTSASSESRASR